MLTKEIILAAEDLTRKALEVPEWGGAVYVRTMCGTERDEWEKSLADVKDSANVRARLAVRCLCDEQGNRLFADADAEALGKKSGKILCRVFDLAIELNRLSPADAEELAKN